MCGWQGVLSPVPNTLALGTKDENAPWSSEVAGAVLTEGMCEALVPDLKKDLEEDQKQIHLDVPSRLDSPVRNRTAKRVQGKIDNESLSM